MSTIQNEKLFFRFYILFLCLYNRTFAPIKVEFLKDMVIEILISFGVIAAIIVAIVMWYVKTQNELVNLDEKCKNALSQIAVQLNSRWDALLALAQSASAYAAHESETLIKTIRGRQGVAVKSAADVNEQQEAYVDVLSRLMAVKEAYPELRASGLFEKTMDSINEYEEKVRMARMIFNDTVTRMNRYVRQWPSSIVAERKGFKVQEYLVADDKQKKDMPKLFVQQ